jgi:plasmid maintenance system antidote protein VapI
MVAPDYPDDHRIKCAPVPIVVYVITGKSGISPEMAIRLTKAFGSTEETWLRMQLAYDLAAARKQNQSTPAARPAGITDAVT